jgi:hypothetical protein
MTSVLISRSGTLKERARRMKRSRCTPDWSYCLYLAGERLGVGSTPICS